MSRDIEKEGIRKGVQNPVKLLQKTPTLQVGWVLKQENAQL